MKRPHKIKHVKSGLYYSPRPSKLSSKGKIYNPGPDVLSYYTNCIYISVCANTPAYKILKSLGYEMGEGKWRVDLKIPIDEFVREEI